MSEPVYLHTMYSKAWSSEQFLVANVTLEMFGLLMLHQYFFIVKLAIAVPEYKLKQA